VCEVTGLKATTLRKWHLRSYYIPEVETYEDIILKAAKKLGLTPDPEIVELIGLLRTRAEQEKWRVYTFDDICRLTVMRRLTLLGVTPERASAIVQQINGTEALRWNASEVEVLGRRYVVPEGRSTERPPERCSFLASFLPKKVADLEDVADPDERKKRMSDLISRASRHGESTDSLAEVFKGHDCAILINQTAIAREVREKLADIEKRSDAEIVAL